MTNVINIMWLWMVSSFLCSFIVVGQDCDFSQFLACGEGANYAAPTKKHTNKVMIGVVTRDCDCECEW